MPPQRYFAAERVLAFLMHFRGTIDTRGLAIETGLGKTTVQETLGLCEDAGWLVIGHGRPHHDPEGPEPNQYKVTEAGRARIPAPLNNGSLPVAYALSQPLWTQEGGFGIDGLLLALALGPGEHFVTTEFLGQVLGIDRRTASKRLARWGRKEGRFVIPCGVHHYRVTVPEPDANPEVLERLSGRKVVVAVEKRWGRLMDERKSVKDAAETGLWFPAQRASKTASDPIMLAYLEEVSSQGVKQDTSILPCQPEPQLRSPAIQALIDRVFSSE